MSPQRSWQRALEIAEYQAERLNLPVIVTAILDAESFPDAKAACAAVRSRVMELSGRDYLTPEERSKVDVETGIEYNARREDAERAAKQQAAADVMRPEIEGIDLIELAAALLSGAVGDYTRSEIGTREQLVAVLLVEVERRTGIETSLAQRYDCDFAASVARANERAAKERAARETATALHDPLMSLRRRVG